MRVNQPSITGKWKPNKITFDPPHLVVDWKEIVRLPKSKLLREKQVLTLIPRKSRKISMAPSVRSDLVALPIYILNAFHLVGVVNTRVCRVVSADDKK